MLSRSFVALLIVLLTICAARSQSVDLTCFPISGGAGIDPIVRVHVARHKGEWRIVHFSAKGKSYDRAAQYWILDKSAKDSISWTGSLLNHNDVKMTGAVIEKNGASFYKETVYNARTHSAPVENDASCVGPISWTDNEPVPQKLDESKHPPDLLPPTNAVVSPRNRSWSKIVERFHRCKRTDGGLSQAIPAAA
jgi:hypothetical protein